MWHAKELSLLNGHEYRAQVNICSPSLPMMTSPNEWKILEWDEKPNQTNKNYKYTVSGPVHHMSPWTRNVIYFRIFRQSRKKLFQIEFANEIFLVGTMQVVIVNLIAHKGKEYLSAANSYNIYFLLYLLAFLEKLWENNIISFDISTKRMIFMYVVIWTAT